MRRTQPPPTPDPGTILTRPMRHDELEPSVYSVRTDYGLFHICEGCRRAGHCPPRAGADYQRHPLNDTHGCECEHISHTPATP